MQQDGNISTSAVESLELPSMNEQLLQETSAQSSNTVEEIVDNAQRLALEEELQSDLMRIFTDCETQMSKPNSIDRTSLLSITYAIESYKSKRDDFDSAFSTTSLPPPSSQLPAASTPPPTTTSDSARMTKPPLECSPLFLSEKQVMRLLLLTGNDQSRLAKSYICGHIWADLFEARVVDIACIESVRVLINLVNMLANLLQHLTGIRVCQRLVSIIHSSVDFLLAQGELSAAYNDVLKQLKSNPLISESRAASSLAQHSKRIAAFAASEDIDEKIQAVNLIFDIFSDCMTFEQQINLFATAITPILKDLVRIPVNLTSPSDSQSPSQQSLKELLTLLAKLVLALLVNPTVDIDINPHDILKGYSEEKWYEYAKLAKDTRTSTTNHDATSNNDNSTSNPQSKPTDPIKRTTLGNIVKYEIDGIKSALASSQKMYSNIALIVNSLLLMPADNELMRFCLQILTTLYKLFPEFRENLRVPLLTVLQNIASRLAAGSDAQEHAAIFLYEVIHSDELPAAASSTRASADQTFIAAIKENAEIMSQLVESSPFFHDRFVTLTPSNKSILKFEDLIIHKTFAIQERIEAEKGYTFFIEITQSWSIIYVGFATHTHDIKVHLNKIEDFADSSPTSPAELREKKMPTRTPYTILSGRVNCEQDPFRIVVLVESPGLYSITFDNSYSWFNSKQLRYRSLTLTPVNTHAESLRKHILFTPLHFDCLNLSLFKKFDANWCELHLLAHSLEIDMITADKQSLRDVITSRDLARANEVISKRFPVFVKSDYFSILVIYESQAWTEMLTCFAQTLIASRVLTRAEVDQRRTQREFQLSLLQRLLKEKFQFLSSFKTLSMEAVEDISYFWFKQAPHILSMQAPSSQESPDNHHADRSTSADATSSQEMNQTDQVVLLVKCNPASKVFAMKLYQHAQLHGVKLEDLDEELFGLCEVLLTEKDPDEYFLAFCEFMKAFLLAHQLLGISKLVLFLDPSNLFWTQEKFKLLQSFLHTQLTNLPTIPLLIMSSI